MELPRPIAKDILGRAAEVVDAVPGRPMQKEEHPVWLRYATALAAVVAALALTLPLLPAVAPAASTLFFAAIVVSAWYGGLGPGLLATLFSVLSLDYFVVQSVHFFLPPWSSFVRLVLFVLVALLTSSLTAARKRAEEKLRQAYDELEMRVEERTAELTRTTEALRAEISERKKAEAEVAQAAGKLSEQNKELLRLHGEMGRVERLAAIGRITGTIAHELGTPLNSVLGYVQLLVQEELSESAHRRAKIVEAQIQRMIDIIQSYLSRARGSLRGHHRIDINGIIVETLELLEPIFQQHGVRVHTALTDSLPPVRGDDVSLQRVLINLLDNAIDAMEAGGEVTVASRLGHPPRGKRLNVIVEITDSGVGIAPDLLPKIFEFFVTTKASGKGTGLGLAVCQEIVKGHGGAIEIMSRPGEGTRVQIFLPPGEQQADQSARAGGLQ